MNLERFRRLEINGGRVITEPVLSLRLPVVQQGYADAQIDDYGVKQSGGWRSRGRGRYPWRPGLELNIRARFSHPAGLLVGTTGFGFWNAPFGDPTVRWPSLPQAVWFFYGSAPTDLPLAPDGPGRGWFVATLDAATAAAKALALTTPVVLLLNQWPAVRRRLWPAIQRRLGIRYAPLEANMMEWHHYRLRWQRNGCAFFMDGSLILETPFRPQGPLGFVCWLDNQYMIATPRGRFRWGMLPVPEPQWMEVAELQIAAYPGLGRSHR
ncbi:MAG: hypothetical protein ACE5E7_05895 [Anaerolineae bacterium]